MNEDFIEDDFIPVYSKEEHEKGTERICGKIYKKHILENGDVKMYCFTKNKKLYYTSCEVEYNNEINKHKQN